MAGALSQRHKINPKKPPNFKEEFHSLLQLHYWIDRRNVYHFEYRVKTLTRLKSGFLEDAIESETWLPLFGKNSAGEIEYRAAIDIDIEGDTIVEVQTVDNGQFRDLYWSRSEPAIVTKKKKDHLYGELEYFYNGDWHAGIPTTDCRRMRFKAEHNKKYYADSERNHAFAFNVRLRGKEEEIDPDIKNPSV